ncbi:MAG: hypothetical protein ACYC1E_10875 [Propionibacteriaceae bacterium]
MREEAAPRLYARMFTRSDLVVLGVSVVLVAGSGVTHASSTP